MSVLTSMRAIRPPSPPSAVKADGLLPPSLRLMAALISAEPISPRRPLRSARFWPRPPHHGSSLARAPRRSLESAGSVMAAIEQNESSPARGGDLSLDLVDKSSPHLSNSSIRAMADSAPSQIPAPAALDLLLEVAMNRDNGEAAVAFPSRSRRWRAAASTTISPVLPSLTASTSAGSCPTSKDALRHTSCCVTSCMDFRASSVPISRTPRAKSLAARFNPDRREHGGFYASQDADINLDDDGDYFTWTLDEARAVLEPAELEFASSYWDIGELGDMPPIRPRMSCM